MTPIRLIPYILVCLFATACISTVQRHPAKVINEDAHSGGSTLSFSNNSSIAASGGWSGNIRLWQMQPLKTEHSGIINEIRFGPDGDYLASISLQTDSAVLFLNPANGETIKRFQKHELCGVAIAVSPNGRYISTTSDDASVRFYDLKEQTAGQ